MVELAVDIGSLGQLQDAWRYLESAVTICPTNAAALGNLGYLSAMQGELQRARILLEQAICQAPTIMEPWVNLGNVFKEEMDHARLEDGKEEDARETQIVWRMYITAYRLQPRSIDVTANAAGLYAMDRVWEKAALFAEKSLRIEYTEEAFCVLMKALDNICNWNHPMRDMPRLLGILRRNVCQMVPCSNANPSPHRHDAAPIVSNHPTILLPGPPC